MQRTIIQMFKEEAQTENVLAKVSRTAPRENNSEHTED